MRPTAARASGADRTATPLTATVPDVGARSPASMRSSVVLPAPFGPKSARHSPASSRRSTPSTTRWPPNSRVRRSAARAGGRSAADIPQDTTRGATRQRGAVAAPSLDHEQRVETRRGEQRAERRRGAEQSHGEPAVEGALPHRDDESEVADVRLDRRAQIERDLAAPFP